MIESTCDQQLILQTQSCEKSEKRRTLSLFPVSNLRAMFHNDGIDNEAQYHISLNCISYAECKSFVDRSFNKVSVTRVMLNLLVWTVSDTGRGQLNLGGGGGMCKCLVSGVPLCDVPFRANIRAKQTMETHWWGYHSNHLVQSELRISWNECCFSWKGWLSALLIFSATNSVNFTMWKTEVTATETLNLSHGGRPYLLWFLPKYLSLST